MPVRALEFRPVVQRHDIYRERPCPVDFRRRDHSGIGRNRKIRRRDGADYFLRYVILVTDIGMPELSPFGFLYELADYDF